MNYRQKDLLKFSYCTHVLSIGVKGSSSHFYSTWEFQRNFKSLGEINRNSIVGLSANGDRPDRVIFPVEWLIELKNIGCVLITDNNFNRNRKFNIGEREIAHWLIENNYNYSENNVAGRWELIN